MLTFKFCTMKKVFTLIALFSLMGLTTFAQRIGYIDSDYVMSNIPEYQSAQDEIEDASERWQEELEKMYQDIERLYSEYQAGEVLMTEETRKERQEEIFGSEREAKEFRETKFGQEGEIFKLQESKIRPIQDKVFKAVEAVSRKKRLDFVFDKSGEVNWLFANPTFDMSKEVLAEMGYKIEEGDDQGRN